MFTPAPRPPRRGPSAPALAAVAFAFVALAGVYWMTRPVRDLPSADARGRPAGATVDLSDDQMRSIRETGRLRVRFEDGREIEVEVPK